MFWILNLFIYPTHLISASTQKNRIECKQCLREKSKKSLFSEDKEKKM